MLDCNGVPVIVAVLSPLSVKVKKVGNVEAVIVLISLSSSEITILYVYCYLHPLLIQVLVNTGLSFTLATLITNS